MAEQRAWLMEVMAPDGKPLPVRFYLLTAGKVPTFTAHAERARRFAGQADVDAAADELLKAGEQPAQGRFIPQEHGFVVAEEVEEPEPEPEPEKAPPPPPSPARKTEAPPHRHTHRDNRRPGR